MRRNKVVPAVLLLLAACRGAGAPDHVQSADSAFRPSVASPAVFDRVLRVVIDEAHENFHTAAGRYQLFAQLLRDDGLRVDRGVEAFSVDSLNGIDLLVIANASSPDDDRATSAFTAEEVSAVEEWVCSGEAALFTSQVIRGRVAESMGREELRIGMSRTDTDNEQLALNTVRWLVGLL